MKDEIEVLIAELLSLEEVKKFQKLEGLVENNPIYLGKMEHFFALQKQMTNAKEFELWNAYEQYKQEYQQILLEWKEDVLLNEYFNSLEEVNWILKRMTEIIESKIDKTLND